MASSSQPCTRTAQLEQGFACFRSDQTQYHGTPVVGSTGLGPVAPATTRLLIGYDHVVARSITLGTRLGYAFGGGSKPDGADAPAFVPLHLEARLAWYFGRPVAIDGLRIGASIFGGIAQLDTPFEVTVVEDANASAPAAQLNNPPLQTLTAYHKAGIGFAGAGPMLGYVFDQRHAIVLEFRAMAFFPSPGLGLAPIVGYELGL